MVYKTDMLMVRAFAEDVLLPSHRALDLKTLLRAYIVWAEEKNVDRRVWFNLRSLNEFLQRAGFQRPDARWGKVRFYCRLNAEWEGKTPAAPMSQKRTSWKSMTDEQRREAREIRERVAEGRAERRKEREEKEEQLFKEHVLVTRHPEVIEQEAEKRQITVRPPKSRYLRGLLK